MKIKTLGNPQAPIVIITEPPNPEVYNSPVSVMRDGAMQVLGEVAGKAGVRPSSVFYINPCPPIPEHCNGSDSRTNAFVDQYAEEFWQVMANTNPKIVVSFGKIATRVAFKRAVKITEVQGTLQQLSHLPCKLLPVLSPGNVVSRPEVRPKFEADMRTLGLLLANNWDEAALKKVISSSVYEWCLDLSELLANRPKSLCVDTETSPPIGHASSALDTFTRPPLMVFEGNKILEIPRGHAVPLICQLSYKKQHALVIPLDRDYYPEATQEQIDMVKAQLKELLEDPNIPKTGHNFGYDMRILHRQGIYPTNWYADTILLTFALDENMQKKSLDEAVARWLPEYAGYSKEFEAVADYNRLREIDRELMIRYAGGDTDVGYQLAGKQLRELYEDKRQWNVFHRVKMPALRAFTRISIEGWRIDKESLRRMWLELEDEEARLHENLLRITPQAVINDQLNKRKPGQSDKELFNFKSPQLIREILFTPKGYNLEPVIFTDSTMNLTDDEDKRASTSSKKHLPYFDTCPFVKVLEEYVKLKHLMDSFVGYERHIVRKPARKGARNVSSKTKRVIEVAGQRYVEEIVPEKGVWKHIDHKGWVHPQFHLHKVVTGRTSCSEPNIQQVPKRGKWAKRYREIYMPDVEGGYLVAADLSQIELRLVAWMAQETTMLEIYRTGGDIHAATGASVSGIQIDDFYALETTDPDQFEFKRYLAKAVNFGFIYGAWWTTFQTYAKTQFGIDVSDRDAKLFRERFFERFYLLPPWHEGMKKFAHKHGYVRSMHGAIRRLPDIYSPDKMIVQEAERKAVNSPIQCMGSDLGLLGLIRFDRDCPKDRMRVKGFVHDQIIVSVDNPEDVPVAESALKFYMQTLPLQSWFGIEAPLPILSDVESGPNMGALKKRKDVVATPPPWYREDLDRA